MKKDLIKDCLEDISYLGKGNFGIILSIKKRGVRYAAKGFISIINGQECIQLLKKVRSEYYL